MSQPPEVSDLLTTAVGAVPGGTARHGQQQMAEAIYQATQTKKHLLVQAGTGTGKSLAYLVPALLAQRPVVVATATLALQNQLINVDMPRLADAVTKVLGRRPKYALLKGRHHYACLARLDAEDEPDDGLDGGGWVAAAGKLGKQIIRLREWSTTSDTGDRDELDPGVDDRIWRQVSMPARECVGATRCSFGDDCFAEASRTRARDADIIITNHSLLALDMLAERPILPAHSLLIIDEAHELADRVTSATQAELSADLVERAARRARRLVKPESYEDLVEAGDRLALALADLAPERLRQLPGPIRETLTMLEGASRRAATEVGALKDETDPVTKQQARAALDALTETAQRFLTESAHDVAWVNGETQGGAVPRRTLAVAPLSVGGLLATKLYAERTVVATSATLTLGGSFDSVARSLGLTVGADTWSYLDVGSPFTYEKQGILYVASHLPRPGASGLSTEAAEELLALVEAIGGRTLGLFSSRKAANQAAELLRARTTGLEILVQGEDTIPLLVKKFRAHPAACLLGVMSLWQGVDLPGDTCQLVVIDRLPFPRPDDPLSAARSESVDASGGSGFAAISVPAAAVKLAQGVGRLIRTSDDKGLVAVLDSRLHNARSYGPYLRKSLPPLWYTTSADKAVGALTRLRSARENSLSETVQPVP